MSAKTQRLDLLLVERGIAVNRERAQALILSGNVLVRDQPVTKAGQKVDITAPLRLRGEDHPYVSRGALKLVGALDGFKIDPMGRIGLDVGASTGGFTEVLLLRGATRVHAVDVGHNQMAWKIRSDSRVKVYEKVNARSLPSDLLGEKVGIIVMDVSFISVTKILPALLPHAEPSAEYVILIKPQFEVGREGVGKGGIVRDESLRMKAVEDVTHFAHSIGLDRLGLLDSPIEGTDGNREYLAWFKHRASKVPETGKKAALEESESN